MPTPLSGPLGGGISVDLTPGTQGAAGASIKPTGSANYYSMADVAASAIASGASTVPRTALPAAIAGIVTLPFATLGDICYEGIVTANITITVSGGNIANYQRVILALTQDGTGSHAVTLPSLTTTPAVGWPNGVQPTVGTAANARSVMTFANTGAAGLYDGNY